MSKNACLCTKNTWFSNTNAYFNTSSKFSSTYFSTGGAHALQPPLKPSAKINGKYN